MPWPRTAPRYPSAAETTWNALAEPHDPALAFDPDTLATLPPPARRLLGRALPLGTPLVSIVELRMSGEMRLGKRWLPFTAEQILRAGVGFVWRAVVGGRIVRFVGADIMSPDLALMEFRVHGVVPVVRASGPHVTRSAAGRLAAETATWLPQALTPQMGAAWTPLDDQRATVTLGAGNETVDVNIDVDTDGRLVSVGLQRWNGSRKPPGLERFGGEFARDFVTSDGVRIGSRCRVGWGWGTPSWPQGMFFRADVTAADRPGPTGPGDESTAIDRSEH